MDKDLLTKALTKFLLGVIVLGALLFLPAGSFRYWQGWLLMGILFVPMFIAGLVMMTKNPYLLRKRLNAKEKEAEQKTVVAMSGSTAAWQRSATLPTAITSGSSRKKPMMGPANSRQNALATVSRMVPYFTQKRYPSLTRAYSPAP